MGPEIALQAVFASPPNARFLLVIQRRVVDVWKKRQPDWPWHRLTWIGGSQELSDCGQIVCFDPSAGASISDTTPGVPTADGAAHALAAIQVASDWALAGALDAIVTGPVSKAAIANSVHPRFRGHTDFLAQAAGLKSYGSDYLMGFLTQDLNVALHSVHLPLRQALDMITKDAIVAGLVCLNRHLPNARIAVAGLNPHAGEQGLLGSEDQAIVEPAVGEAIGLGIHASGPYSPDSLFARARAGEFEWVYALYHDQGLIAIKTIGFGSAVNWTIGLPYIRVSVDHGTAFDIAGQGVADFGPMQHALNTAALLIERKDST